MFYPYSRNFEPKYAMQYMQNGECYEKYGNQNDRAC